MRPASLLIDQLVPYCDQLSCNSLRLLPTPRLCKMVLDSPLQEKTAFIFCVEDRALFCQDCDEPVHSAGSIASNHQRFLATGIKVALGSKCGRNIEKMCTDPGNQNSEPLISNNLSAPQPSACTSPSWAMDDLLHFSDFEATDKKETSDFGEQFEWFTDIGLFDDQVPQQALAAVEVPQLPVLHKTIKVNMPNKKLRIETPGDDECFTVPDLG